MNIAFQRNESSCKMHLHDNTQKRKEDSGTIYYDLGGVSKLEGGGSYIMGVFLEGPLFQVFLQGVTF